MLTQQLLKERFEYCPKTGIFVYLRKVSQNTRVGDIAGCVHKPTGYHKINITLPGGKSRSYPSHRLAFLWMTGRLPESNIDHINGDKLDNRWDNLREATDSENNRNARRRKDNKSGVCGVYWEKRSERWLSTICFNKKHIRLGLFDLFEDAVKARKEAEKQFGFHDNHGTIPKAH